MSDDNIHEQFFDGFKNYGVKTNLRGINVTFEELYKIFKSRYKSEQIPDDKSKKIDLGLYDYNKQNEKHKDRALELFQIITAEFESDPSSVQCFDLRIVNESKMIAAKLRN